MIRRPAFGPWTAKFDTPRSGHVHGALDIAPFDPLTAQDRDRSTFACVGGLAWAHWIVLETDIRDEYNAYGKVQSPIGGATYPFANYTAEVYGGCVVLVEDGRDRTFVYAHYNLDEIPSKLFLNPTRIFHKESNKRWVSGWIGVALEVEQGEFLGFMGYAGTTGSTSGDETTPSMHLHIEGHPGYQWVEHAKRIRIEDEVSKG